MFDIDISWLGSFKLNIHCGLWVSPKCLLERQQKSLKIPDLMI